MPGDALTTAGVQGLTGGLLLIPLGMALSDGESHNPADWSTRSLLGLLYLIVFGSIFGYTAYVWLVANVSLGTVATYAYVNPLVAITLGILFLDEVITWQIAAGAAVILTSVAVVIRREVPRRPEAAIPPRARLQPLPRVRGRSRPAAPARDGAAFRWQRASRRRPQRSRRRWAARRRP